MTGANKGIGYAIVEKLCSVFDGIIYLTGRKRKRILLTIKFFLSSARNEELGLKAVERIHSTHEQAKAKVTFHQLDLTSVESIRHFADYLRTKHGGLVVLINNAAIVFKVRRTV